MAVTGPTVGENTTAVPAAGWYAAPSARPRDRGRGCRRSALLGAWHDLDGVLRLRLRVLLGAFLLERLAGLLGQVLSRRLVGHGCCSLVGSLISSAVLRLRPIRGDVTRPFVLPAPDETFQDPSSRGPRSRAERPLSFGEPTGGLGRVN